MFYLTASVVSTFAELLRIVYRKSKNWSSWKLALFLEIEFYTWFKPLWAKFIYS